MIARGAYAPRAIIFSVISHMRCVKMDRMKKALRARTRIILVAAVFWLFACAPASSQAFSPVLPPPVATIRTSAPPTPAPSPTATPTVAEWIYPYTIAGLRQHDFESGKIRVGAMSAETDLYRRYPISYPSDGLTVTGTMQIPQNGEGPFPVIVMNHGYFNRDVFHSGDGTDRAAAFLNRRGYLTLSPDYRSWGGSDSGSSLFYSGLVIDVINLLNAIPSIPEADPARVGMWGHSMGGGVTLKVLTVLPVLSGAPLSRIPGSENVIMGRAVEGQSATVPQIKAAILYSPVSADDADIIDRWGPGCIGDIAAGEKLYGCNSSDVLPLDLPAGLIRAYKDAAYDPHLLEQVAALLYLEDVTAPVQIHYGTEDGKLLSGTPPEWSRKAYDGFLAAGKQAELFAYAGEGHSFLADQWWHFMERCAWFFDENVK